MDAKETARKILDESHIGTMATVQQNKPHSRYMTFFNDGFTLYTVTSKKTEKVDELEQNPHTHILIGYEGDGFGDAFLEIQGTVEISQGENMIDKVWNEYMEVWFEGPNDPNLVILKITPEAIRVMNKKGEPPQDVQI
ncbi:pyridoxamine 5'-phosphate oxidase family protein [Sporosarcina sp. FSL W7-1349]|uniref:pyridoxamine 5'-phosphate oxidase family protein n=1 Tax=Bacillales TaxID=1385 RepID=UPI0005821230|nr:pyridoxamine 5'-phosphate oxidase family protein [Bacillus sp. OxB-1]BAQ08678.1 pyridoxamine 5'-phosphate oxidase-like [Bacillus sp. OxB-1]